MQVGPWGRRLLQAIGTYNLDRQPGIRSAAHALRLGKLSERAARAWLVRLQPRIREAERIPIALPRPPDEDELYAGQGAPEVVLGTTETGLAWGIRPLSEVRHMLVTGTTGMGKSCLLRRLVIALRRLKKKFDQDVVVVIVDSKRDFHDVRAIAEGPWQILDAPSTLHWGNQRPPGVSVDAWINIVCTILEARTPMKSSRTTVAKVMRVLWKLLNQGGQGPELWPSWHLILETLNLAKPERFSEKAEYTRSARQVLTDLVLNSGEMFNCFRGLDIVDAVAQGINTVICVDQLALPWLRHLLVEQLASSLFLSRLARGGKSDRTEILLIIDESDEFISIEQDKTYPLGLSPFGRILKQAREFGIGVVLAVTVQRQVSPLVLSNCSDVIVLNQADPESTVAARRALMLPHQADAMIAGGMKLGQAVVRQGAAAATFPFRVDLEYVPPYRGQVVQYDQHAHTPGRSLQEMPDLLRALRQIFCSPPRSAETDEQPTYLSKAGSDLLTLAVLHPFEPVARLLDRTAGMSRAAVNAARAELADAGLADFAVARFGRHSSLLIEVTEKGFKALHRTPAKRRGRGGLVHRTVAHWCARLGVKRGYKARVEWLVEGTGHHLDAGWEIDGKLHGFEVCVEAKSNLVQHCRACFLESTSVERLTIVVLLKGDVAGIQNMLAEDVDLWPVAGRIDYLTVEEIMKELWP